MKGALVCGCFGVMLLLAGCGEETPTRDYIPVLRKRLFKLQVAVKEKNTAAIDSLLSVKALSLHLSSDSLLHFVYGEDSSFPFYRFGNAQYLYTNDKARIDCFIMDSTETRKRPVTFTFVHEHDLWLLKRFEPTPGPRVGDSL